MHQCCIGDVYHQECMSPPEAGRSVELAVYVLDKVLSDYALIWKASGNLIGSVTSTYEVIRRAHALHVYNEEASGYEPQWACSISL